MLTYKDAILIGERICEILKTEQKRDELQGPDNKARYAARGIAARSIEEIYFQMPDKYRAKFDYKIDSFFKKCGWPE